MNSHGRKKISWDESILLCHTLYKKIASNFRPNLVVGISEGGVLPTLVISGLFKVNFILLDASRPKLGSKNVFVSKIINLMRSNPLLNKLMMAFDTFLYENLNPKVRRCSKLQLLNLKKILVVDDDVCSGATLKVVKKFLMRKGCNEMKIATLNERIDFSDYSVMSGSSPIFPWMTSHEDYSLFKKIAARYKLNIINEPFSINILMALRHDSVSQPTDNRGTYFFHLREKQITYV